jgi:hypothetical protein
VFSLFYTVAFELFIDFHSVAAVIALALLIIDRVVPGGLIESRDVRPGPKTVDREPRFVLNY